MAKLEVANIHWSDVYKDIARIPEVFRIDDKGQTIPEGTVCRVSAPGGKSVLLALRGQQEHNSPAIHIDERTRNRLGIKVRDEVALAIRQLGWWGQFRWALDASDPAYRIASQLAVVSVALGLLGLGLGVVGIWIALKSPTP